LAFDDFVNSVYFRSVVNSVYSKENALTTSTEAITGIAQTDRRPLWVMGSILELVIDGDQTGGSYAVAEDRSFPGFGPPPHVHTNEDEAFYVIEGEYVFGSDETEVHAGPGTFVHAPKGHLHWWRNVGEGPGRHLEIFVPAGLERMFQEVGEPVDAPKAAPPPPDPQRLLEAAPRYGVEFRIPRRV
jgi:mannose-6-phosphate isomerase-like protein (cupin superfamily)